MNTFVPFDNLNLIAQCLDNSRLNKQVLETVQIIKVIENEYPSNAWKNHPAVVQWHGHEYKLAVYGLTMEHEANKRGIKSNQKDYLKEKRNQFVKEGRSVEFPSWWGFEPMHKSHRSNLTRKDKEHYSQYFKEPAGKPYIWIRDNKLQFGSYRSKIELDEARKMQEVDIWAEIIGKKL